jgi:hypothetical protein
LKQGFFEALLQAAVLLGGRYKQVVVFPLVYSCMQNSLAGKVVIVTGANSGLGLETSKVRS